MIRTYTSGETVQFMLPRYSGETATTAYLRQYPSTNISSATVSQSNRTDYRNDTFPMVMDERPNDNPIGSFIGSVSTTGLDAGEYYVIADISATDESGNAATYKRSARFYVRVAL